MGVFTHWEGFTQLEGQLCSEPAHGWRRPVACSPSSGVASASKCSTSVCDPSVCSTRVRDLSSATSWRLRVIGREKRDLAGFSSGSSIPKAPAAIRMTPTICRLRLPILPFVRANVKIAPRTMRKIAAALDMNIHPFRASTPLAGAVAGDGAGAVSHPEVHPLFRF